MSMRLATFRSLWTNGYDLDGALEECSRGEYDGVEGPVPVELNRRGDFVNKLKDSGVPYIAEITTGGSYVPSTRKMSEHLNDLERRLAASQEAEPLFCTILGGCDAWSLEVSLEFFDCAIQIADQAGAAVSFETHRSRSTFTPWQTAQIIAQLPSLRLTADFSHWCCVCERLVLEEEPELLARLAARTHHVHARVGYEQGPQVPNPAAPEYGSALAAHERWWEAIWQAQEAAGYEFTTLTPEFGPDGYLQAAPFSQEPVASLDVVNEWMAGRQRERFSHFSMTSAA